MKKSSTKNNILSYVIVLTLFVIACILQQTDDLVLEPHISKFMSLLAQIIFFDILTYWTVSVINRISEKSIKVGLIATIVLMASVMLIRLVKYNVLFDTTAERFAWYTYYIPQCLAPVVLLITVLGMDRKKQKKRLLFGIYCFYQRYCLFCLSSLMICMNRCFPLQMVWKMQTRFTNGSGDIMQFLAG